MFDFIRAKGPKNEENGFNCRTRVTIMLLWQEFMEHHPGERVHQYSQFSVNYRHYVQSLKRSLRMVHRAGEKLFIDYAGPTIKLTDGTKAHIYVAALGASSYTSPMATSNSPTYGQSNSPMAGQLDYAESEAIAIREAASFIR